MIKIKAIIFDMDGVLVDAKEWHYEALNRALSHFGYSISRYDHLVTYDGLPTVRKLEMLSVERGLPTQLHEFLNGLKQLYTMELIHAKCKPVFQCEYTLSKLKERGYRLAVCSNSIRETVEVMLKKSNLLPYFEFVLSNQDVTRPKPDPEIYAKTVERFGLTPEECLVLEDNENGIQAAQRAKTRLMTVKEVYEVNLSNILSHIQRNEMGLE